MSGDYSVAVIGGGFSGTILAINLCRILPAHVKIILVERTGTFARGVAYAASEVAHLLNVRAGNMSAFADDPHHFERWLNQFEDSPDVYKTPAGIFASRRLYGQYLQDILRAESQRLQLCKADITNLERHGAKWVLCCNQEHHIVADNVVLACGSSQQEEEEGGVIVHNPWSTSALQGVSLEDTILIAGSGLTMVDMVASLKAQRFRGRVIAVSRRGLLPKAHRELLCKWPTPHFSVQERSSILSLLRAVRRQVKEAASQGVDWRAVIDSLRPITVELWRGLSRAQQAQFLRHLRPYWDIHRHRMAPCVEEMLVSWQRSGQLQIERGCIAGVEEAKDRVVNVELAKRGDKTSASLRVQRIIYATGLKTIKDQGGLLNSLLKSGIVQADALNLGLNVDDDLSLFDGAGEKAKGLWALGPLIRGVFWECTSVPDIRVHAQQLSRSITKQFINQDTLRSAAH